MEEIMLYALVLITGIATGVGLIMPVESWRERARICFLILGLWAMVGTVVYAAHRIL